MALRGILFDMGGTLLHYRPPGKDWEQTERIGAQGVYAFLRTNGHALPDEPDALDIAWDYFLDVWRNVGVLPAADLLLDKQMANLLRRWGIDSPPGDQLAGASRAYMDTLQVHVRPLDGAAQTLQTLRERNFRVGLISNTLWPNTDHMYDLNRHGLTPFIEHFIFSGEAGTWKPNAEIFQRGLKALDLEPDEAIYVGDSLYFDVWGAQQAGLRGVWIEQPERHLPDGLEVTPDATIQTLPELLSLAERWREER